MIVFVVVVTLKQVSLYLCFQASGEKPEMMSNKDAAMFPLIASVTLFGIYIFFQVGITPCNK